jgi:hypothetical protein
MPEDAPSSNATKTEFSGPADLLALAHKAADPKGRHEGEKWIVGERGAWSEWLCIAIKEKLVRDGHWPTAENELKAEVLAMAEIVGLPAALETLRKKARATGKAA